MSLLTAPAPQAAPHTARATGSRPVGSPPVLVALLLVLAGVVASALLLRPSAPAEDSAEVGFARDMSVHHAQAVAMAEAIRDRTADPELRVVAQDIALTQQAQIGAMGAWLDEWGYARRAGRTAMAWMDAPVASGAMPGMASSQEVAALSSLPPADAEDRFLSLMIAHHVGGVHMAEAGLQLADDPDVQQLATSIAAAQTSEIDALQDLRAARGLPPAAVPVIEAHDLSADHHAGATGAAGDLPMWLLVVLGGAAAAWLVTDSARRAAGRPAPVLTLASGVAAAAGVGGAALHAALTPAHAGESLTYGLFFAGSAAALTVGAALVLAGARSAGAVLVGGTSLLLLALWTLFRIVAPPGASGPESVDAWGLAAVAVELVAVAAVAVGLRRPRTLSAA